MEKREIRRRLAAGETLTDSIGPYLRSKHESGAVASLTRGESNLFSEVDLCVPDTAGVGWFVPALTRLRGWRLPVAVLLTAAAGFVPAIAAYFEGNLHNPALHPDLLHDVGYWNQFVFSLSLLVFLMPYYFGAFPEVLARLATSEVIAVDKIRWRNFCATAARISGHWATWVVPLILALGGVAMGILVYGLGDAVSWQSPEPDSHGTVANWLHVPLIFLHVFIITSVVAKVVTNYLVLRRFFEFPVTVQPLHPDRCGGLAELGRWSARINGVVLIYGIVIVLGLYSNASAYDQPVAHPVNLLMIGVYVAVAVVVFFLPLWSAHSRMDNAKYEACETINRGFERTNQAIMEKLRRGEPVKRGLMKDLHDLQQLHAIAGEMPVFPFNTATVRGFLASILVPILGFLADFVNIADTLGGLRIP